MSALDLYSSDLLRELRWRRDRLGNQIANENGTARELKAAETELDDVNSRIAAEEARLSFRRQTLELERMRDEPRSAPRGEIWDDDLFNTD
ncbi:MAG: hypothetical protein ACKVOE_08395 [Rickettsiales bacterium]